jgi:hypothetical protein
MKAGLVLKLPRRYSSDLVYVQEASLGKPDGLAEPGGFRLRTASASSDPYLAAAVVQWEPSEHAQKYRVTVSESPESRTVLAEKTSFGTSVALTGLPAEKTFHWKVEAVSWGGKRWNEGGSGVIKTPPLKSLAGITFVSDMPWARSTTGAGNEVRRDTNLAGAPIKIAGKSYRKGLWMHAFNDATPADVDVAIDGKRVAVFAADVGVEATAGGGSIQFLVLVDGKVVSQSPVMWPAGVHRFRVEVRGARTVTLRVLNGGDGFACDHAAWGFARFVDEGVQDALAESVSN